MNKIELTREQVLIIVDSVETLYEFYLERMLTANTETRMRICEARNKIQTILCEGWNQAGPLAMKGGETK